MNNALLEKLFEKYEISEKDIYEINQIFAIVSDEKKHKILASFEDLAKKIKKIEEENILEQSILLDNILPDIKQILK
jgi:predicted Zn-ribbon and HTH transcriptional regulator